MHRYSRSLEGTAADGKKMTMPDYSHHDWQEYQSRAVACKLRSLSCCTYKHLWLGYLNNGLWVLYALQLLHSPVTYYLGSWGPRGTFEAMINSGLGVRGLGFPLRAAMASVTPRQATR